VVLVVEAANGATRLKAVRVVDRPCVHLGSLLLAVEHDLEPCFLEQAKRVAARPAPQLVLVRVAAPELLDELFVAVDVDLLAPILRVLEVAPVERPAGARLSGPRRRGGPAGLVGRGGVSSEARLRC